MPMNAILGYARVSTTGQDLDAQLAALSMAGVDPARVFTDKLSGSAKTARPGLVAMLDYARAGDTVVVTAIDRLGRGSGSNRAVNNVNGLISGYVGELAVFRTSADGRGPGPVFHRILERIWRSSWSAVVGPWTDQTGEIAHGLG
jgi:hypothetical protein